MDAKFKRSLLIGFVCGVTCSIGVRIPQIFRYFHAPTYVAHISSPVFPYSKRNIKILISKRNDNNFVNDRHCAMDYANTKKLVKFSFTAFNDDPIKIIL